AITERTAALVVVHRSNFQLVGFTHSPALAELAALAKRRGVLLLDDLGSGTLLDTARFGLAPEPTVQARVAAGADLVCFSGDKLLGGPQAGFIVGRREAIAALKKAPLLRALRVDKVTLAGIEATLRHYQRGDAVEQVPVWRAIGAAPEALRRRAEAWRAALAEPGMDVVPSTSAIGGGSLPGMTLPTHALALRGRRAETLARALRKGDEPVVGRIEEDALLLDPRTVREDEDERLVNAVKQAWARSANE
ncbi:MAG: L-seryl-tRNA(Sec) selenium transferase, partial [Myxococcales bacterium]